MPKINVYLPEDLATAVREVRLSVSAICQKALAEAVRTVGAARDTIDALRDPEFDPSEHPQVSAHIASQMTRRLWRALEHARDFAGGYAHMQTEDLLVGVIDEPDNLGIQVLKSLDIDVSDLRSAAARAANKHGRKAFPQRAPVQSAGQKDKLDQLQIEHLLSELPTVARLALAGAIEAAIDLDHEFLGCEHLVLALADCVEGTAKGLLRDFGVKADAIRRAIPAAVAAAALGYTQARQGTAPTTAARLEDLSRQLTELQARVTAAGL